MQDAQSRMLVRPVFAAIVFGLLALLFLALASRLIFAAHGESFEVFTGFSLVAPCVPLVYFAARGFAYKRSSAFQDMPERACGSAALAFLAAALIACASGVAALAVGPGIAALLFALCVQSVRNFAAAFP